MGSNPIIGPLAALPGMLSPPFKLQLTCHIHGTPRRLAHVVPHPQPVRLQPQAPLLVSPTPTNRAILVLVFPSPEPTAMAFLPRTMQSGIIDQPH